MTNLNLSTPALAAEATLDDIIIDLLNGEPGAAKRWIEEVPALLDAAPDYDVVDTITWAIQDALTA
jgi:hypothetical protein